MTGPENTGTSEGSASPEPAPAPTPAQSEAKFHTVARVGEIPVGEGRAYHVGDRLVAVFFVEDRYTAIDDMCPHMGASLAEGYVENGSVYCPWHAWRFNICNGLWQDNPRAKLCVEVFEVRVEGNEIQVRVPE